MLDLYLIRHAESDMNNSNHLIGGRSNDTPLTKRGMSQAKLLGWRLKSDGIQFDKVYSSTALRANTTAQIVSGIVGYQLEKIVLSEQLGVIMTLGATIIALVFSWIILFNLEAIKKTIGLQLIQIISKIIGLLVLTLGISFIRAGLM